MNKIVQTNSNRLSSKDNKITDSINKGLGKEILDLYELRKIAQFHNDEKLLMN